MSMKRLATRISLKLLSQKLETKALIPIEIHLGGE